jgi:hypothetical protein
MRIEAHPLNIADGGLVASHLPFSNSILSISRWGPVYSSRRQADLSIDSLGSGRDFAVS